MGEPGAEVNGSAQFGLLGVRGAAGPQLETLEIWVSGAGAGAEGNQEESRGQCA